MVLLQLLPLLASITYLGWRARRREAALGWSLSVCSALAGQLGELHYRGRMPVVVALAGRRIDAPNTPEEQSRFSERMLAHVGARLRQLFQDLSPAALTCAAACGADIIALETAEALQIPGWIVLPFEPARFRETSVIDRGEIWGPLYDHQVQRAAQAGRLVLATLPEGAATYLKANEAILDRAVQLAGDASNVRAVLVWEGKPRPGMDVTQAFGQSASARGIPVLEISTR